MGTRITTWRPGSVVWGLVARVLQPGAGGRWLTSQVVMMMVVLVLVEVLVKVWVMVMVRR